MDINYRYIDKNDFHKGYLSLINSYISYKNFCDFVNDLNNYHQIIVIEKNNNIIGTGTIFIEKKLTYDISYMGHIENILIHKNYRSKGYGEVLVKKLIEHGKNNKCYRIDLNCGRELENFYRKNNFRINQISMRYMIKENFK
jgi:glucosamine-phosphate N-acetyltransferase